MTKASKSFQDLMNGLQGKGVKIGTLSEVLEPTEAWSTGNLALDSVTGIGGIPVGRIISFEGVSQSGKTTAAIQTAAVLQKKIKEGTETGYIMFLDFEQSIDLAYCRALGLDPEHESFVYMSPVTLEEGANAYREFLNAGHIRLCIVDSVAAMVSEKESAAETGAVTVADRAKAIYQFCRQILAPLQHQRSSIIFLNHVLAEIPTNPFAARFGPKKTNPGGNGIPYYASMRIEFEKKAQNKANVHNTVTDSKEETVTSTTIAATVIKNKVSKPMRVALMRIRYGLGFSQPYSVAQVLAAHGVLTKRGNTWIDAPEHMAINNKTAFHGEERLLEALESNPEALELWTAEAQKCIDGYTPDMVTLDEVEVDGMRVDKDTGEILE